MKIDFVPTKHGIRYFLLDAQDTPGPWFDSLTEAAAVARFISGEALAPEEYLCAVQAMKNFDSGKGAGK